MRLGKRTVRVCDVLSCVILRCYCRLWLCLVVIENGDVESSVEVTTMRMVLCCFFLTGAVNISQFDSTGVLEKERDEN